MTGIAWLLAFACGCAAGLVVIAAQELRYAARDRLRCTTCGDHHPRHAAPK